MQRGFGNGEGSGAARPDSFGAASTGSEMYADTRRASSRMVGRPKRLAGSHAAVGHWVEWRA